MNKICFLKIGLIFTFAISCASGCQPSLYQDSNSMSSQPLSAPKGEFESVAWLDENHIAFIYRPDINLDFRIGIFEISTRTTSDLLSLNFAPDCDPRGSGFSYLSRLPNGSLGFILHCGSIEYNLYLFNPDSNETIKRQTYLGFIANSFSFSPDMSQLVQENGIGGGLGEKLLLVSSDRIMKELLRDFQRARAPAWSSDGKTIAFAGTKENPEDKEIASWQNIESLFFYPWDIYIMDADGTNARILLPSVGTIYGLKWSPTNENLLLFGGTSFDNAEGVWLLDISNMSVKRIWNENTEFDWSPDGSKIVVLDNDIGLGWNGATVIYFTEQ